MRERIDLLPSPGYPIKEYGADLYCSTQITAANPGDIIHVKFTNVGLGNTSKSQDCADDFVEVKQNVLLVNFLRLFLQCRIIPDFSFNVMYNVL